jgi:hypothetical protein
VDADLYVRKAARPTDSTYACRSAKLGNGETCTRSNPAGAYWYVRVSRASGAGTVKLVITLTR